MWIWRVGGGVLGLLSALLGREAILTCTEAVERTVHRHLNEQIHWADTHDPELARTIREIQVEEVAHLDYAQRHRTSDRFRWLDRSISLATETLIWVSTRGDSQRLVAEITRQNAH